MPILRICYLKNGAATEVQLNTPCRKQCFRNLLHQFDANTEFTNLKQRELTLFQLFKTLYPDDPLVPLTI